MPQMAMYDMRGEKAADIQVPDGLLALPLNRDLVHQAVLAVDAQRKRRCGKAKTRGEVTMTGAKWYRQKGLGRARHGAQSAPVFVGGGKAHGPTGEQGSHRMPRKMRQKATLVALSQRLRERSLTVVDKLEMDRISTRTFVQMLDDLDLRGRILMVMSPAEWADETLAKSSRNIPGLVTRPVPHFNTRDVVLADEIVVTKAALDLLAGGGIEDAD